MKTPVRYDEHMPTQRAHQHDTQSKVETIKACPVEQAILVIGGKWKLLLLRTLLLNGPQGYNELLAGISDISAKELTRNLRELLASGLVERRPGLPARTQPYMLTRSGKGLMPTFKSLLTWGTKTWYAT
jgi:DNA-binding HxlR family transcriptional regulator